MAAASGSLSNHGVDGDLRQENLLERFLLGKPLGQDLYFLRGKEGRSLELPRSLCLEVSR